MKKKNLFGIGTIICIVCLTVCCILNCWSNNYLENTDSESAFFRWLFDVSGSFGITFIAFTSFAFVMWVIGCFSKKDDTTHQHYYK